MQTVLIAVHLIVVVALVAVVLLQRSEGGALGVGGGSGFMTGRGQANVLTRATAILAALFFLTSLGLTLLARYGHGGRLDFNVAPNGPAETAPAGAQPAQGAGQGAGQGSVLDQLRRMDEQPHPAPAGSTSSATPAAPPAATTPAAPTAPARNPAEPSGMPDNVTPTAPSPVTK